MKPLARILWIAGMTESFTDDQIMTHSSGFKSSCGDQGCFLGFNHQDGPKYLCEDCMEVMHFLCE
jgi:hypothetical protein